MSSKTIWKIDPSQSKIAFKVGFMQLGVITGEFRQFDGTVESDDVFEELAVDMTVDPLSVTTFHSLRDEGIRSASVFEADAFPLIKFTSTSFLRISSGGLFELAGLLTIRDSTIPLQMMVSMASLTPTEAVFKFSGNLSRQAFGVGGPATPDQESIDDEVEFFGEMGIRR
jgi:polyisoprenoid-binding protein YceI